MDSDRRSAQVERLEVVDTGRRRRWSEDEKPKYKNNAAERARHGLAAMCSLFPSSSSIWKHWKLILGIGATRAICSRDRGSHSIGLEIGRSNLMRRARYHLLSRQNTILNQASNPMM